ncbi:hypothetical protein V7S43_011255 [Phytophthora oleae]|uniref:RxLR effector PexRD54 WY domain-containing protein n=1 Tax=Phytophthora oleae TaxID=2107226 RepID=A0ABD3FAF5_9STRA
MRLPSLLMLAAVALLASADAASSRKHLATPNVQDLVHGSDNWHDTKRLLRTHVDSEERAISAPSVEMLQGWMKKGLISDEAVGLLSLGNKADDLLTGSLLNAWFSYVKVFNKENPTEKMNMIKTLTARFGDEALSTMIETAKRSSKTSAMADKIQAKQIANWAALGKNPDDIFEVLKLNSAKSLLFDQPPVNTWLKFMDDFALKSSSAEFSAISTLRKYYSDATLAKMIIVASKSTKTSDAAKRVETELLRTWFNSMKSPTDVLRLLKLNKASQSSLSPIWTKYVALFNKVDPKFKTEMLQEWVKKGLITDDTFRLLTLGNAADDLLNGSLLSAWATYIKVFNQQNPTEQLSLIAVLTARFGDEAVSTMVEAAKKVPTYHTIANSVQTEQMKLWLNAEKIPDDIFVLLKLNTVKTKLFDQPQLNTWVVYLDKFNKANPNSKTTLFSTLQTRYSEATLAQMLVVAKTTPGLESLAVRIQAEQTRFWLNANRRPGDIFKMLRLNILGSDLMHNQLFTAWVKYTDEFRKLNPGTKLTTLATLRKYYSDETLLTLFIKVSQSPKTSKMGKRMQAEMLREWFSAGTRATHPTRVFELLNLGSTGRKVLESPLYTVWTNYIGFMKKADSSFSGDAITLLRGIYGDKTLANVLIAAGKVQSTKDVAKNLEKELFALWKTARVHPTQIHKLLRVENVSRNSAIYKFYGDYVLTYART